MISVNTVTGGDCKAEREKQLEVQGEVDGCCGPGNSASLGALQIIMQNVLRIVPAEGQERGWVFIC